MTGSENLFIIIVNAINNRLRMNLSSLRNVEINCIDLSDGGSFAGTLTLAYVSFRFDLKFGLTFVCIADRITGDWMRWLLIFPAL